MLLDHLLIGAIRQELRRNGWRNRDAYGRPVFVIDRRGCRHSAGDADHRDVTWALAYMDRLANG